MSWKLKTLGVRGSMPVVSGEFMEYGGNTSSFCLEAGAHILLDAGTGICSLRDFPDDRPIHILISHVHLDHISGLPGFAPIYEAGREIHIYGQCRNGESIGKQLGKILAPPFWPISIEHAPAGIHFHDVNPGETFLIGEIAVDTVSLNHPDGCTGFCISGAGKKLCYLLDCELQASPDGNAALIRFMENSDAVIMDGMFLPESVIPGIGHSSWNQCVHTAKQAKVKRTIISHFGCTMTDKMLRLQEETALGTCLFAREGMEIEI